MREADKKALLNRLKSARGHVDAVIRMVETDTYCVDVMKQLAAVQGSLEASSRAVLRNHLETLRGRGHAVGTHRPRSSTS